ncbi:hypothetical protein [Sporomusa sp.]|uniref:hypothetical protein n=1 Tax=Sporomusa sp. TaxID=2078658 RepID=UPI002C8B0D1C|nr:hypothetical protein [Sporomusa sp.]HWR44878.1 hypothetical protein [Sporomusa sp.]
MTDRVGVMYLGKLVETVRKLYDDRRAAAGFTRAAPKPCLYAQSMSRIMLILGKDIVSPVMQQLLDKAFSSGKSGRNLEFIAELINNRPVLWKVVGSV